MHVYKVCHDMHTYTRTDHDHLLDLGNPVCEALSEVVHRLHLLLSQLDIPAYKNSNNNEYNAKVRS